MKLKTLWIDGFKNLSNINIDFSNKNGITVLIGNNGSGKSNVLEAISKIFFYIYHDKLDEMDSKFKFVIEYNINNFDIQITKKRNLTFKRKKPTNKNYQNIDKNIIYNVLPLVLPYTLVDKPYYPSQVIALYSGEESRLWEEYYKDYYIQYNKDVIQNKINIEKNPPMIYINKYYWDIALLTMFASDISIYDVIENVKLKEVRFEINLKKLDEFRRAKYNEVVSFVDNFYFDINGHRIDETQQILIREEELKDRLNNETHRRLFNLLCVAKLPKQIDDKLIMDLELKFDNGLSTRDLSEGTKKRILLKLALNILADTDSLVLFDEPDSHIHVANKKQIKTILEDTEDIETILTTHSPTLMNIFENHLEYLENGQIRGNEKAEILKEISGDTMSDAQRQILLNANTDILIVEGKTDEKYISTALEKLKQANSQYEDLEFNYLYMGGSDPENLKKLVEQFSPKDNQTIIAFFDNDGAGYNCITKAFNYRTQKHDFTRTNENGVYICLYPKKDGFVKSDFEIEDYFKIETCRDFMFSSFETFQDTKKKFKKDDFAEYCPNLGADEFDGFKKLFDLILEIKGL
ncbi:AAA family ATPase [Aliarcobacter cryaerophilus]|uniref:AAA family ATPase n=1 Tax=Aliarcobacter cryaerophilus TaxID=28198 RepID=UPI003DA5C647